MVGLSRVNRASNSLSGNPCGCSDSGSSRIRSTTLTTRTAKSGSSRRRMSAAASVSWVGMSPAQASTTSGSAVAVLAHCPMPSPRGECGLLAGDDDVDVVAAAQAVIGHRQQGAAVRRQVDPRYLGALVGYEVDKPRILMRCAIVVLTPNMRTQQIIE